MAFLNASYVRALELYIQKRYFTILFNSGKISQQVLANTQQEYAWAVGAVESDFQNFNSDKAKSFYQMWRSDIPNRNVYLY